MLGEGMVYQLPLVVGFKLFGVFNDFVTSTDVVVAVTKRLKSAAKLVRSVVFETYF